MLKRIPVRPQRCGRQRARRTRRHRLRIDISGNVRETVMLDLQAPDGLVELDALIAERLSEPRSMPASSMRRAAARVSKATAGMATGRMASQYGAAALLTLRRQRIGPDPPGRIPGPCWRMGRDSNPRWTCAHAGFQDRCIQPLCHPSGRPGRACAGPVQQPRHPARVGLREQAGSRKARLP